MCTIHYASHEVSVVPVRTLALTIQGFLFLPNSPQELVSASAHGDRRAALFHHHTVKGRLAIVGHHEREPWFYVTR